MRQFWDWSIYLAFIVIGGNTFFLGLIGLVGWDRVTAAFTDINAAWVQAIGGLAGLAVAIAAPYWHARMHQREADLAQLKYLQALLLRAGDLVGNIRDAVFDGSLPHHMDEVHLATDYKELANLFERLPFHEIVRPELVLHLLRTKYALTSISEAASFVCGVWEEDNGDPEDGIVAITNYYSDTNKAIAAVDAAIQELRG